MPIFGRRTRALDLPSVNLRLVDLLGLPEPVCLQIKKQFDVKFGGFLQRRFPDMTLCRTMEHLNPLYNAYIDDRDVKIAAGEPYGTLEEWSRVNGARYTPDHVSLPHEGVRWFELRSLDTRERVGALQISKIDFVRTEGERDHLCGFAIMTLPRHPTLTYPEYWGEVLKALLDADFVDLVDPRRKTTIEEWVFPLDPKARYVDRVGDTFGGDVIRTASEGILIERGDDTVERAPRYIRKRPRLVSQELEPVVEIVVQKL